MYLQRIKILRRQANWRSRSLSRHEQPKFAQLSNALRNASADRRQNPGVPVLCRWRMHQKGQGNGGRVSRAKQLKDHLSYGGRVALRRCPFFMPGTHPVCCLGSLGETKIEKTSKLITNACLFFKNAGPGIPVERQARKDKHAETLLIQGFSVLWRGRSPSHARELGAPVIKLEKTSKLKRSYNNVSACSGEREARAGVLPGNRFVQDRKNKQALIPFRPSQLVIGSSSYKKG